MEENFQTTTDKSELSKLSIKDLFFKYIRFLPLFIVSVALALLVAFLYLRYATPIYQSTGQLMIKEDKKKSGDKLEELMSTSNEVNIQNEIELLKSRPLMERVVDALNLQLIYFAKGKVKESNIYKSAPFALEILSLKDTSSSFAIELSFSDAYSFKINSESQPISFGQVFKTGNGVFRLMKKEGVIEGDYIVKYEPRYFVAKDLASSLIVAPKGNTKILIQTLQATNPIMAADIINRLMTEYSVYSVEDKNETINQQLAFINGRLNVVDNELDSITKQKLNYQLANNLIDIELQSTEFFGRINEADRRLTEQYAQLEILQIIDSYLRNSKNDYSTTPSSLGIADPTLNNLIAAYNVAQLERKALLDQNVPAGNPVVEAKQAQIEKLRQNILENLRSIRGAFNSSITDLRRESGDAQSRIRALPVKQQRLLEIQRQLETKQAVYGILLEQRERSSITLAATTSDIKVVEPATPNGSPVSPNRRNIQMIAIFIGLILPALFIFILELLNDKVNTRYDIERMTSATILGEVGHSFSNSPLVVTANNRSIVAEQFRIIRSNLQYVINHISNPVILVTSSFSGEGKSFVSTNIGSVMALAGKRTIILEFDIRKPKILSHLGLPKRPGLTNYLLGKMKLEDLPLAVPDCHNLYVLPCGPVPPNPAEILLDEKFKELFVYLRANFDMIIMDTAPVGMVSDAQTLSQYANATLYIVRQGRTYKKQIGLIDELYRQHKLPKISILLNDVKVQSGYGYYGYGRYGYGYGYGSGYFDDQETPPPGIFRTWMGWIGLNGKHKKKRRKKETV